MFFRLGLLVGILLLVCGTVLAEGDSVYRPELHLSAQLTEILKWTASVEPKISDDVQNASEIALVTGLCWKPASYLAISPEFKYISKGGTADSNESRPRLSLELSGPVGECKVALRNRFEYRMKESQDEYWRYRSRLKVSFPKIRTATPFIYEEIFYEFGDMDEYDANEAGLGLSIPLADKLTLEMDLRSCHTKSDGDWQEGDIHFLMKFKYSF